MKAIFVFVLLEVLLAGVLIGCQTQGLDLEGDLRLILRALSKIVLVREKPKQERRR